MTAKLYVVEERMRDGRWAPVIGLPRRSQAYEELRLARNAQRDDKLRVVPYAPQTGSEEVEPGKVKP